MKKQFYAAFLLSALMTASAYAQFGMQAGPGISFMNIKEDFGKTKYEKELGITLGIHYRASFSDHFAIQPEINFTQKGGEYSPATHEEEVVLNYFELPIYFLYQQGRSSGFFGGIAPAFNYGSSGTYRIIGGSQEEKRDITFGSGDDEIKSFHLALNVQAGYRFGNGMGLNAFLSQSLTNSANVEGTEINLFTFGARFNYSFVDKIVSGPKKQKNSF